MVNPHTVMFSAHPSHQIKAKPCKTTTVWPLLERLLHDAPGVIMVGRTQPKASRL